MGHGHSHHDNPVPRASRRIRIILACALAPFFVATAVGLVVLWPRGDVPSVSSPQYLDTSTIENATVLESELRECPIAGPNGGTIPSDGGEPGGQTFVNRCMKVVVSVDSGPEAGREVSLPEMTLGGITPQLEIGESIVVSRTSIPQLPEAVYNYSDIQRRTPLALLAAIFVVIVIGIARLKGLSALIGLGVTLLILVKFMLPAILEARDPVAVALVGSSAAMIVILYLTHGFNARTATALLGTLVSLILTAGLAVAFVSATKISGQSEDEYVTLAIAGSKVTVTGLLLAGIIIGSLGVLNDVTVTQASAVWELHRANPELSGVRLYRSVMRIGRDHIASVVDTLVLAYAGASLPLLVLFSVAPRPLGTIVNGEIVAIEIVRTLVGSIGLVLSVPITTALAVLVVARSRSHLLPATVDDLNVSPEPGTVAVGRQDQLLGRRVLDAQAARSRRRRTERAARRQSKETSWQPEKKEREFWDET